MYDTNKQLKFYESITTLLFPRYIKNKLFTYKISD